MNCEQAEKIIVDCLIDDMDSEDKGSLLRHVNNCKKCRESYFEFRELLKNSTFTDKNPEPRYEIIDRLQQIARINSQKDDSLLKRYFRMPVFVPLFGAAMALMIFLNIDINPQTYFTENNLPESAEPVVKVERDKSGEEAALQSQDRPESKVQDKKKTSSDISRSLIARTDFSPGYRRVVSISDIDDKFFMNFSTGSNSFRGIESDSSANARLKRTGEKTASDSIVSEKTNFSSAKVAANSELKEDIAGKNISVNAVIENGEGFEVASTVNNPEELLSLNTESDSKSKTNNCDQEVLTNNKLQGIENADFEMKKDIYMDIAECYEHRGHWEKAIENYHTLKEFDSQAGNAYEERINFIEENYLSD